MIAMIRNLLPRPIIDRIRVNRTVTPRELAKANERFVRWRQENPNAQLSDYYAANKKRFLFGSSIHSTIGGILRSGDFQKAGIEEFDELLDYGLSAEAKCVDYGCGTLRIGQHVIRYLAPGCYWGMDIDKSFLDVGSGLIGTQLVQNKKPNLRVITSEAVAEAAASKPGFLFSYKVMQHVHPEELESYLRNVITIIGLHGTAFISNVKWRDNDMVQYKPMGWAHDFSRISRIVTENGASLEIVKMKSRPLPLKDAGNAMRGTLKVTRVLSDT